MPIFTKQQRKLRRTRQYQRRLQRLGEVSTCPAQTGTGIVVAVMVVSKPDPQRGEKISGDYFEYMKPWWNTVNRVGLSGVILHDGLPEELIEGATTERIRFERAELSSLPILHDRYRIARDYLRQSDAKHVFITDISDVAFKRDPFVLIEEDRGQHRLFLGAEEKTIAESNCLREEMVLQFGSLFHGDRQIVNPGIHGGDREEVLALLELILDCIEENKHRLFYSDMSIFNKVVHDNYLPSDLFTGLPLHSRFKKWEFGTEAAIMHK